jgi:hypothetical protein
MLSAPVRVKLPPVDGKEVLRGDQVLRKEWAEEMLRGEGIPVNPHLPVIESIAEVRLRTPREVADRLLALITVAVKGEGLEQEHVEAFMHARKVKRLLTPEERAFVEKLDPDEPTRIKFCWRYEAAWVLLWALKQVDGQLGPPRDVIDVGPLVRYVRDTEDLHRKGLQSVNDILCEADLIYRCHWAVRQAELDGAPPPAGLNPSVTFERHHALNWLVRYDDADWDDVPTHT